MLLKVRFEQALRPGDPLLPRHFAVDERRHRAGQLAQAPPKALLHQCIDQEPPIGFAERLFEQLQAIVMALLALAKQGIRRETQSAGPRRDIGSGCVNPLCPIFGIICVGCRLRNPFHIKNAVAQPEDRRNKASEPLAGEKRMVAQPAPANAFGKDKARLLDAPRRCQPHFKYSLEMRAAHLKRSVA